MRKSLILLSSLLITSPALAQAAPSARPPLPVPPQLTDPAVADRLGSAMQALSKALLDLPVGGIEAALDGRQATAAERRRRVRDIEPGVSRDVEAQIAQAKPMVRQSIKTLNDALPAIMQGLEQAQKSFERAMANMPDPTYPKR